MEDRTYAVLAAGLVPPVGRYAYCAVARGTKHVENRIVVIAARLQTFAGSRFPGYFKELELPIAFGNYAYADRWLAKQCQVYPISICRSLAEMITGHVHSAFDATAYHSMLCKGNHPITF